MKIEINGIEWTIEEGNSTDTIMVVDGNFCKGVCLFKESKIILDSSLKMDSKKLTLRHELTHAFMHSYLLEGKDKYGEEEICEFMAKYSPFIVNFANRYEGMLNIKEENNVSAKK